MHAEHHYKFESRRVETSCFSSAAPISLMETLREAALQIFLVAGFQVSLEAFFQIEEVLKTNPTSALEDITTESAIIWRNRGLELQEKVYASNTEKLRQNLNRLSPELSEWTVLVGYGLVLSR